VSLLFGRNPRVVVHPPLVAAAYILSTAFAGDVTPAGYVRSLLIGVFAAGLLTLVGWAVVRNRWDGALLATTVIAVLVSPASMAWGASVIRTSVGASIGTVVVGAGLIAILGYVAIHVLRARRQGLPLPKPAPETLNLLSIALVAAVVGSSVLGGQPPTATAVAPPTGWLPPASQPPDIVVVLLDGYPRSDVLDRRLGTDNAAFLAELAKRGFDVATTNHSNYTLTQLTFPSMFQMRYLDELPSIQSSLGSRDHQAGALRDAAQAGQALSILRAAGYEVVMSSSGWEQVTYRQAAERLVDTGELNDLEEWLLHRTWLVYLFDAVLPSVFTSSQRDRIVHAFDTLDTFAAEQADHARFLFLHVPGPHLPLVLRADGTPAALTASRYEGLGRVAYGMTDAEYEQAWQSEVSYLDDRVLEGIDQLLASEHGQDAVIVVMSDHGYGFEARPDDRQARLANLLATRTPDAPNLVNDSITPVNLFRVLSNRYLGTDFPLLPNRYFLPVGERFELTEIGDPDQTPSDP
jgi:hypothetical protein